MDTLEKKEGRTYQLDNPWALEDGVELTSNWKKNKVVVQYVSGIAEVGFAPYKRHILTFIISNDEGEEVSIDLEGQSAESLHLLSVLFEGLAQRIGRSDDEWLVKRLREKEAKVRAEDPYATKAEVRKAIGYGDAPKEFDVEEYLNWAQRRRYR